MSTITGSHTGRLARSRSGDGARLPAVEHSALILAPVADVFAAIATPEGLNAWLTRDAALEARPGGRIRFRWSDATDEEARTGTVVAYERPHRLAFTWSGAAGDTRVEIRLRQHGPGTMISVTEEGFPGTDEGLHAMVHCAAGWGEALTCLKWHLEG